jgi:biopolymer transport protein ExbD/biopolymer transport protein TolR
MQAGGKRGRVQPAMNVTPLVDVVLVLLIIFMVITPLLSKQFYVHLPKEEKDQQGKADDSPPVVLKIAEDGSLSLNGSSVEAEALAEKLKRVFAARHDHVLFFDAADGAPYGATVEALDKAREGGAVTIAAMVKVD